MILAAWAILCRKSLSTISDYEAVDSRRWLLVDAYWHVQVNTTFEDLQNENNPRNGRMVNDSETALSILQELRDIERPCACQFMGDNGFNVIVGVAQDFGCVQYSSNDGTAPFLMAVSRTGAGDRGEMEFLVGGTLTPIDGRYRVSFDELREIVAKFVATGERCNNVSWEELD